jgi:hypothetical protein
MRYVGCKTLRTAGLAAFANVSEGNTTSVFRVDSQQQASRGKLVLIQTEEEPEENSWSKKCEHVEMQAGSWSCRQGRDSGKTGLIRDEGTVRRDINTRKWQMRVGG